MTTQDEISVEECIKHNLLQASVVREQLAIAKDDPDVQNLFKMQDATIAHLRRLQEMEAEFLHFKVSLSIGEVPEGCGKVSVAKK